MKYWGLENSWKPFLLETTKMDFTYFMFDDVYFKTHQNPFVFMDLNVCIYVSNGELGIATNFG